MANYNNLKQGIQAVIKENHNNEITGQLLQQALLAMINSLGVGYQFIDVAKPSTNPGSPDQRVFYIAEGPGNYVNFNAEVFPGELAIFEYSTTWLKQSVQVSDLKNIGFVGTFQSGIALDPSDGEEITDTTYDASDYIPVEKGSVIIYSGGETDGNRAAIIGYDADKYMVNVLLAGGSDWVNKIVPISDPDIKYVRVSSCNSTHPDYGTPFAFNVVRTTELLVEIDGLKNDVASLGASVDAFAPVIQLVRDGYIYQGIAIPGRTYPEPDDLSTFYWIETAGTYPGGVLGANQVGLLRWTGADWTIDVLNVAKKTSLDSTNEALTAASSLIVEILSVVAAGYEFIGVATPSQLFPEDTYKHNVMYLAQTPGTYTNLGNFQIAADEVALLMWNAQSEEWSKQTLDVAKKSVVEDTYAKKVGFFPRLIAGCAQGLMNPVLANAIFLRRITGGAVSSVGSGPAVIKRLGGVSRVWNQLYDIADTSETTTISDVTITDNRDGSYTLNGTASADISLQIGKLVNINGFSHKILIAGISGGSTDTFYIASGGAGFGNWLASGEPTILTSPAGYSSFGVKVNVKSGVSLTNKVIRPQFVDLTQLFNGSVPEGYTVADFKRDYPLNYYAYTTGKVLPFAAQNLETTGVNQWDEEWERGSYRLQTGEELSYNNNFRTKNPIAVFGGVKYYFKTAFSMSILEWDINGNYLGYNSIDAPGIEYQLKAGTAYIRFTCGAGGADYNHDICINISDPAINGQYFPYQKNTLAVNPGAWQDADGNLIYPGGGMQGLGAVQDFALADADGYFRKATQVWGKRAYEAGDEIDPTLITDGTDTYYPLATPVEKTLKTPVPAIYIEDKDGTEEWTPANTDVPYTSPCDMDVQYPLNVFGGIVTALNAMLTANSLTGSFSESNGNIIYTN